MTLHSLSGAWPISKPVQRLAGIRRLERNARRWRLRISRWIYEVTGPRYALRCFDTHVETRSPPISLQRMNYPIDGTIHPLQRNRGRPGFDVGIEAAQGIPRTSDLVNPSGNSQTPTTSVSL